MTQNRLIDVTWGEPSCAHENCWFSLGLDRFCVAPNRDPVVAWGESGSEPNCAHENCSFSLGFGRFCAPPNRDPYVACGDRVANRIAHMKTVGFP